MDYNEQFTNQFKESSWTKWAVSILFILTVLVVMYGLL
jgi:hypothetical protein